MAKAGWVKSLQCKTNAIDDVIVFDSKQTKKKLLPLPLQACANPSHTLRDVAVLFPPKHRPRGKPKPKPHISSNTTAKLSNSESKKATVVLQQQPTPPSAPVAQNALQSFATLAELSAGHSSRRVVEIIFGSSWSKHGKPESFPGEIELLFRVHHPARAVARFEEHRAAVRARAAATDGARCAADGNETLRFHPAPSSSDQHDSTGWVCAVAAHGKAGGIRTFSGSGRAHDSAGGGSDRRATLVCRVIAGRVKDQSDTDSPGSRYDSVSLGKGELLVFDSGAVLPCFLIIYKV